MGGLDLQFFAARMPREVTSSLVAGKSLGRREAAYTNQGSNEMAKSHEIKAQSRKDEGKGASRRLRHAGFVPAVVYGAGQPPQSIQVLHNTILLASKNEWFFSSILDLNVDDKVQKVLVRDWQKHPFKQLMMHMDFLRVNEKEALRVSVPLHFLNKETSPAAKTAGVVISHNLTEVEVSCLPKDLPEYIDVDLAELKPGDIIHLSKLQLPANVELVIQIVDESSDVAVVTANLVHEEVDEAPVAAAEPAAGAGAAGAAAPAAAGKKDDKPAAAKKDDKK
jgi:large subunit ribosomal protein L25